jgi:hypothetical protein
MVPILARGTPPWREFDDIRTEAATVRGDVPRVC